MRFLELLVIKKLAKMSYFTALLFGNKGFF